MPTIYVSAQRPLEGWFDELLAGLDSAGFGVLWPDEFRGYETIAVEIDSCDALLAVITWGSSGSTWQAIEISLASGFPGSGWEKVRPAPRPVFLYAVTELPGYITGLDESSHPPTHVRPDPADAVREIVSKMSQH